MTGARVARRAHRTRPATALCSPRRRQGGLAVRAQRSVPAQPEGDAELVRALRRGDESAFDRLVSRLHAPMVRTASGYLRDRAQAEEVVQETWLAVLEGIDRFEGRSALRTWIYGILVNRAKTRAQREGRSVPVSSLASDGDDGTDPSWFGGAGDASPGHWTTLPAAWPEAPDERAASGELRSVLRDALDRLPAAQRTAVVLRDVEGLGSAEACEVMEVSEANQRVLLHRGRTKLRRALEAYFREGA